MTENTCDILRDSRIKSLNLLEIILYSKISAISASCQIIQKCKKFFFKILSPVSNIPDSVLRAMSQAIVDHRGPGFPRMTHEILDQLRPIFNTQSHIIIYPSSGTGAWEAALVNTLSPGDKILAFETGWFATLWKQMAEKLGLVVDWVPGDWRSGVEPSIVEQKLREDKEKSIKAICVVHNETSSGTTSRVKEIREAIDNDTN